MIQPQKRIYRNDVSQQTREKQSIAHQGRKHSNDTSTTNTYGKEN